mmetsp:Transcript_44890/g.72247  ORF Transcript_44890/g.72247 Transcript_44890/m.72247 type:complete len:102 (+) Transcript_44890:163-468(+)
MLQCVLQSAAVCCRHDQSPVLQHMKILLACGEILNQVRDSRQAQVCYSVLQCVAVCCSHSSVGDDVKVEAGAKILRSCCTLRSRSSCAERRRSAALPNQSF